MWSLIINTDLMVHNLHFFIAMHCAFNSKNWIIQMTWIKIFWFFFKKNNNSEFLREVRNYFEDKMSQTVLTGIFYFKLSFKVITYKDYCESLTMQLLWRCSSPTMEGKKSSSKRRSSNYKLHTCFRNSASCFWRTWVSF